MRLRSLTFDGLTVGAAGTWWWLPSFDEAVHVVIALLVVGTLAVRLAIAWREWRRGRRRRGGFGA